MLNVLSKQENPYFINETTWSDQYITSCFLFF